MTALSDLLAAQLGQMPSTWQKRARDKRAVFARMRNWLQNQIDTLRSAGNRELDEADAEFEAAERLEDARADIGFAIANDAFRRLIDGTLEPTPEKWRQYINQVIDEYEQKARGTSGYDPQVFDRKELPAHVFYWLTDFFPEPLAPMLPQQKAPATSAPLSKSSALLAAQLGQMPSIWQKGAQDKRAFFATVQNWMRNQEDPGNRELGNIDAEAREARLLHGWRSMLGRGIAGGIFQKIVAGGLKPAPEQWQQYIDQAVDEYEQKIRDSHDDELVEASDRDELAKYVHYWLATVFPEIPAYTPPQQKVPATMTSLSKSSAYVMPATSNAASATSSAADIAEAARNLANVLSAACRQ